MKRFAELTGSEKAIEVVRWICVPVAAVLAVAALGLILRAAIPPIPARPPGVPRPSTSNFQRLVLAPAFLALKGAAIVIVGAKTAPRWRRATAIILAVIWTLLSFLSHVAVHLGRGKPNFDDFGIAAIGTVCGAAFIVYSERHRRVKRDVNS